MPRPSLRLRFAHPEIWILSAVSAVLHFWRLTVPRATVFDELYYERFAGLYRTGVHVFDVHPPLARLMYAGFSALIGARPEGLIGGISIAEMRVLPALFGIALVPIVFTLLMQLSASRRIATLGALAVTFDNALLVQSRAILPDIFLIVFGVAAISVYLAARQRDGWLHFTMVGVSALLAGCALSVKWTGMSALGVILCIWLFDAVRDRAAVRRSAVELLLLVTVPAIVYVGAWAEHFALTKHGSADDAFMSLAFQAQLPGSKNFHPGSPPVSLWSKIADVHRAIRYANGSLQNATNIGSSPWYTWPIMKHPIPMWGGPPRADGSRAAILLIGNPVVWWTALIGAGLGLVLFATRRERFNARLFSFGLLTGAALLNFVPFAAITRIMYLYHYLFALVCLIMLAAFSLGVERGWLGDASPPWRMPARRDTALCTALVGLIIAAFLYFAPFTYGLPLSPRSYDAHFAVLHPF